VESGSIIRGLETLGYEVVNTLTQADLYIVNTCAVTAEAERKSRQAVGKAVKAGGDNAKVIVCGCASEKNAQAFLDKGAFAVVGAQSKNRVLEIVQSGFVLKGKQSVEEKSYQE
jgi:threonylcarbamoyladenosine tRNA methylthiotransferase MtaB